jgi:hypothetical protein
VSAAGFLQSSVGPVLQYSVAEGLSGDQFELLDEWDFGTEDLNKVTLQVLTGRQKCAVDARWLELRILATALPGAPLAPADAKGLWLLTGVTVCLFFAGGFWLWRRSRKAK